MPAYPDPNYLTATIPVTLDVANDILPVLLNMAKAAGKFDVPKDPPTPPKANYQEYTLGLCVRLGLTHLAPGTVGAALIDRFDARFTGAVSSQGALLFADDVTLATTTATNTGRALAQVYATAAHYYLSILNNDAGRFLVPSL